MKRQQEICTDLSLLGRWGNINEFKTVLKNSEEPIDIIAYDEGYFFRLALKQATPELLNTLLKYYFNTQLQEDNNSLSYKVARYKLIKILQESEDRVDEISNEVHEVLNQYLLKHEDSDIENILQEFEEEHTSSHDDEGSYESSKNSNLTAENLHRLEVVISGDMTAEHEIQSGT